MFFQCPRKIFDEIYKYKNSKTHFKTRNAIKDSDEDIEKEKHKLTQHQHALNNYKNLKSTSSKTSTLQVSDSNEDVLKAVVIDDESLSERRKGKHGRVIDIDEE